MGAEQTLREQWSVRYHREGNQASKRKIATSEWSAYQLKAKLLGNLFDLHYKCDKTHQHCIAPVEWARVERRMVSKWGER